VKVVWTREDDIRGGYIGHGRFIDQRWTGCRRQAGCVAAPHRLPVVHRRHAVRGLRDKGWSGQTRSTARRTSPRDSICSWIGKWRPGGVPCFGSLGRPFAQPLCRDFIDGTPHARAKISVRVCRACWPTIRDTNACWNLPPKKRLGETASKGRGVALPCMNRLEVIFAHVIEASVSKEGKVRVHRVVGAVDCGPVGTRHNPGADEGGRCSRLPHALRRNHFEQGR